MRSGEAARSEQDQRAESSPISCFAYSDVPLNDPYNQALTGPIPRAFHKKQSGALCLL